MKLVCIDTTRKLPIIGLSAGKQTDWAEYQGAEKHSDVMLLSLEALLEKNGLHIKDINAFACVVGPGSFTGIRIGMATVKAFVKVFDTPVVSGTIFDIVAEKVKDGVVLLNCTHSSLYYGVIAKGKTKSCGVVDNDKISDVVNGKTKVYCLQDEQERVYQTYNTIETINNYKELLILYFEKRVADKIFTSPEKFEPFYIQLSQAERDILKKQGKDNVAS